MNAFLSGVLLVVLALGASAQNAPRRPGRIAGGTAATDAERHAVILLVTRTDTGDGRAALGGGSIVSRTRVLTAAHVVHNMISVQVGFFNGAVRENRFRRADATYSQPIQSFEVATFANDVAVLQFTTNVFPLANIILVSSAAPAQAAVAALASFGFTAPGSLVPVQIPNISQQTIAPCTSVLNHTASHFCALASGTSVVCGGDNGSGLYTGAGAARRLVGIVSLIQPGCAGATRLTGYARLDSESVQAFLRSQDVPVAGPEPETTPAPAPAPAPTQAPAPAP